MRTLIKMTLHLVILVKCLYFIIYDEMLTSASNKLSHVVKLSLK